MIFNSLLLSSILVVDDGHTDADNEDGRNYRGETFCRPVRGTASYSLPHPSSRNSHHFLLSLLKTTTSMR